MSLTVKAFKIDTYLGLQWITYLLTQEFLADSRGLSVAVLQIKSLLGGLECYKDTRMKDYNITKLIAELTSYIALLLV